MMQKEEINELLQKKQEGNCTPEEINFLESWYAQWNKELPLGLTEEELLEDLFIIKKMTSTLPAERKFSMLSQKLLIAASLLVMVSVGLYFYLHSQRTDYNLALHDIQPGSNKATVTLANGQKFDLKNLTGGVVVDKSGLEYNDGTDINGIGSTEVAAQQLVLATPKGGQYQITLADGSKVWLNAASSLKFLSSFAGQKERRVELTGEAYFQVKHDAKQPFRVVSAGQVAEDLGTSFNINCYADEPLSKTTLVEGSMQIQSLKDAQHLKTVVLKPSQQVSIDADGTITSRLVNTEETLGWKNDNFIFDGEDLNSAMRKIARWYNVDVIYEPGLKIASTPVLEGLVSRKSKLSEVLKWIETVGGVRFKIEGRRVTVMK
ncbi:FecR domain-containing protein [Pedobacter sp. ISL-68]|uniref:FecR family protein n=1 Tax=unclassified Pedobacter TaxID=2628915 RepID=UPI001BED0863|nr:MULTISPECIES: FecR family protein [unclassified Pedobacter]MBT2560693.1 FecR domain-containing protein [Pedobacter sp. ISL-64]MBT2590072.1 FecR domain-containing protein [Pedobacter sp. ISL-68]